MILPDEDRIFGFYDGVVIDNLDPLLIGRLRVMVPGLLEPESDWAFPLGAPGAGHDARGIWCIPKIGSNVTVVFKMGHPDYPRWLPGPWAAPDDKPESPTFVRDLSPSDAVQVSGWQTDLWEIIIDDRPGQQQLVIRSRVSDDCSVRIDGAAQMVEVAGTVGVQIRSLGIVNIEALQVTINGRVVLPGTNPI